MEDFKLDENNDLKIINGDFVIAESTLQHQEHILIAHKGEYKKHPEIGVGISDALLDENPRRVLTQIRRNYEYDGMKVNNIGMTPEQKITVDAFYK